MLKGAVAAFLKDQCMLLSAALAFCTAVSFAPALILVIWGTSMLGESTQERVIPQISILTGTIGGDLVRVVIDNAEERPAAGSVAGIIAVAGILVSATTVFAQLKQAVNHVWNVKPRPEVNAVRVLVRKRVASFLMLLFVAVLLLAAVVASGIVSHLIGFYATSAQIALFWPILNTGITLLVFTLALAAVFRFLPDVVIGWRSVWAGAVLTGTLLLVGKMLTGTYLSYSAVGSVYGAGGALFVLLISVYCSWAIFFFGAEFTQVWARRHNHPIAPKDHAVAVEQAVLDDGSSG